MKAYQRRTHQAELLGLLTEEAALSGQLAALLPGDVWANMSRHLAGLAHPAERVTYLLRTANRVQTWAEVVADAEAIILTGENRVTVRGAGFEFEGVAHWRTMAHLALTAGWCQVGRGRLEKRRAGSAANTPAPEAPNAEDLTRDHDTTKALDAQAWAAKRDAALPVDYGGRGRAQLFKS